MGEEAFSAFCARYGGTPTTADPSARDLAECATGLAAADGAGFLAANAGRSFGGGLYRLHHLSRIGAWTQLGEEMFPEFRGGIVCFGWDWLGRQFALDRRSSSSGGDPQVLMLEPGTGEVLEIPATFATFHDEELVDFADAALAASYYDQWQAAGGQAPGEDECIGYRVQLFLGGEDTIENLEPIDGDVYWTITAQLVNETRTLPPGTSISSWRISD